MAETVFEARGDAVCFFVTKATEDGLIHKMSDELRDIVTIAARRYTEFTMPDEVLKKYRLVTAALQVTFDRTRALLKAQYGLLEGWSLADEKPEEKSVAVKVESGDWLLGEPDEKLDAERLPRANAAFIKFFGAAGLPPTLRKEAVHKQLHEHLEARKKMPPKPPRATRGEANADKREVEELVDQAFQVFHDFLDGYFGKRGAAAFAKKAVYGYDRRAGKHKPSKHEATPAEGGDEKAKTAEAKKADATSKDKQPATASGVPGPVASGAAGATPSADAGAATSPPAAGTATSPQKTP